MLNIRAWDALKKEMIYFWELSIYKFLEWNNDFLIASKEILTRESVNNFIKKDNKEEKEREEKEKTK